MTSDAKGTAHPEPVDAPETWTTLGLRRKTSGLAAVSS